MPKSHIILINPPSPYLKDDRAQPPMGLLYLAANLEKQGYYVDVEDLAGRSDWEQRTAELEADVFGVTCPTPNFFIAKKISQILPSESLKIVGGPHPTVLPEETLRRTKFNVVIRHEGEVILPKILESYEKGEKLQRIYEGGLVDLDSIPVPARHLVKIHEYHPEMEGGGAVTIFTSRGCPMRCAFCWKLTGETIRFRKIDNVINEVKCVVNDYEFKNIIFEDDNFCVDHVRVKKIFNGIKSLGVNIRICPRVDTVNREMLKFLRESGVTEISFGVESGSQKILDLMKKKTTVKINEKAVLEAKEAGMLVKIYLIVGFPGETEETLEETKQFVKRTRPDKWLLQNFVPYPGTDVWNNPEKYGITWMSGDYSRYYTVGRGGKGGVVFRTHELDEEKIRKFHDDLYDFLMDIKPMYRG